MGLFGKKKSAPAAQAIEVSLEDGSSVSVGQVVDCIGDSCPRPQLMTKSTLERADSGTVVAIDVDNPTSMEALPPMAESLNVTHLATLRESRSWRVLMQKN